MKPHRTAPLALLALLACNSPVRVDLEPPSAQLYGRGQSAELHAVPIDAKGRPMPLEICRWSSSDEKVAAVKPRGNDATVTAAGPGSVRIACEVGGVSGHATVSIRVVERISVASSKVELKMLDKPTPLKVDVQAFDSEGRLVSGRTVFTYCSDESICRGDNRGQLWAVGPGDAAVQVRVDEAKAELSAHVVDARTAEGKPKAVKGNPMLLYDKVFGGKR